jgi:hypothetical protein
MLAALALEVCRAASPLFKLALELCRVASPLPELALEVCRAASPLLELLDDPGCRLLFTAAMSKTVVAASTWWQT